MPSRFANGPPRAIRSGFAGRKPSGILAATVCDRGALVSSSFPSWLSLGGYIAPPVMLAKRKGVPEEVRDLFLGKAYSSAAVGLRTHA